jgi:hypothetical protein
VGWVFGLDIEMTGVNAGPTPHTNVLIVLQWSADALADGFNEFG